MSAKSNEAAAAAADDATESANDNVIAITDARKARDPVLNAALKDLKRSGLYEADFVRMGIKPLSAAATRDLTKIAKASYQIPYFDKDGKSTDCWRVRFLEPVPDPKRKGKPLRYTQPAGVAPRAYLTPGMPWDKAFRDGGAMLTLTEGEKKAAAACKRGIITIGLGGVWNWKSKKAGFEFLPDLEAVEWVGRRTELAYDGDAIVDESTRAARAFLAAEIVARGGEVCVVTLPLGKKLDDMLLTPEGRREYDELPRVPFDAKAQIRLVRLREGDARTKKEAIARIALRDVEARGSFHVADGEPLLFDRDERRLLSLADAKDAELRAYSTDRYGVNGSEAEWAFLHEELSARALRHGAPTATALFSHYDKKRGALYLFCGAHTVFKVTADGCETVPNGTDDVLFRGFPIEPVTPAKRPSKAAFREVLGLPNFAGGDALTKEQEELVYELHFWSLLFPSLHPTRPLLLLVAVKGSGKTAGARALGLSLFGAGFEVQAVNRDNIKEEVIPALVHNPYVVLDNLDGHVPGLENLLAQSATGAKIVRRALYTTMTKVEYPFRARVVATSRQPDAFARDDVRDRTLVLKLERLTAFLGEGEIKERTLAARPAFWAYLLDRLPAVIRALAAAKPATVAHRLADFAAFCAAAGPALGYRVEDVAKALDAIECERNAFASQRSNVLRALEYWVDAQRAEHAAGRYQRWLDAKPPNVEFKEWTGDAPFEFKCEDMFTGEVFEAVKKAWRDGDFPFRRPDTFGSALVNEQPMLRAYFDIQHRQVGSNKKKVTIVQVAEPPGAPEEPAKRPEGAKKLKC